MQQMTYNLVAIKLLVLLPMDNELFSTNKMVVTKCKSTRETGMYQYK